MSQQVVLLDAISRFLGSFFTSMFQVVDTVSDFWRHKITNWLKISELDNLCFSVNRYHKEKMKANVFYGILKYICINMYTHTNTYIWEKT